MTIKILSTLLIFAVACNPTTNTQNKQEATQEDPIISESAQVIPLPDMAFDSEQFGENGISNNHPLSETEIQQLQIENIDQLENRSDYPGLQYFQLKEIYSGDEGKVVLISRTYEMENYSWLTSYDPKSTLIDFKTIFYDEFAESAHQITSVVGNNKINISEYNMNLETGKESTVTKAFHINEALKFVADNPD